jgi:hypothetical protein
LGSLHERGFIFYSSFIQNLFHRLLNKTVTPI